MIDLRNAKPGDILLSKHGQFLIYVTPLTNDFYDHEVQYLNGSRGSRTHSGHVYKNRSRRLPGDHDIKFIIGGSLEG
jgi:hypothetical protein